MSGGPILTTAKPTLPQIARGWPLLPVPDADGVLAWPDPVVSIRQMIERMAEFKLNG